MQFRKQFRCNSVNLWLICFPIFDLVKTFAIKKFLEFGKISVLRARRAISAAFDIRIASAKVATIEIVSESWFVFFETENLRTVAGVGHRLVDYTRSFSID